MSAEDHRFADLGRPRSVFAIGAVHGEADRLGRLHGAIAEHFEPGDRLVYLGNVLGRGPDVPGAVREALAFRRYVLALPTVFVSDIVFLRGAQEEMWQKLLQIQFAPDPAAVFDWMLEQGIAPTLEAYGARIADGRAAIAEGVVGLARWTNGLRDAMRREAGHNALFTALKRAAFVPPVADAPEPSGCLFVSAGVDVTRPLAAQGDSFWWGGTPFDEVTDPYAGFATIVRGFDPRGGGPRAGAGTQTLDGGGGRGGGVVAAHLGPDGAVWEVMEA